MKIFKFKFQRKNKLLGKRENGHVTATTSAIAIIRV